MSDIPTLSLTPYVQRIDYWNDYYRDPGSGSSPEGRRAEMVKRIQAEFDTMATDAREMYVGHLLPGAKRISKRDGTLTGILDFGSDYVVVQDDPDHPIGYRGTGRKTGPWVEGSTVRCKIGGENVSGYLTGYARLSSAAVDRLVQERRQELRARLQELGLEDDEP